MLRPEAAVSVIETDIEADVVSSLETERLIQEFEEQQQRNIGGWVLPSLLPLGCVRAEAGNEAAEAVRIPSLYRFHGTGELLGNKHILPTTHFCNLLSCQGA